MANSSTVGTNFYLYVNGLDECRKLVLEAIFTGQGVFPEFAGMIIILRLKLYYLLYHRALNLGVSG